MPLFASSISAVQQPGVFLIEQAAPTVIDGVSNGFVGLVFQGEWGPVNQLYKPTSGGDMINTYFPPGSPHNSTGYYTVMRRKQVPWAMVRILGSGNAAAHYDLLDASSTAVQTLTAKYEGTLGNSITATVANATDGNTDHYDLTVTLTDPVTGTTSETYQNLSTISPTALPDLTASNLLASAALIGTPSTRPANGTFNLASGSNGSSVSASTYNTGLGFLATDETVRLVCVDDCGDSIRSTVNADILAHVDDTANRIGIIQGDSGNNLSAVLTDVANYRDDRIIYCGSWVNVLDDSGTKQKSPFATFVASAIANLEPQQSHAWWDDRVTTFYNGIDSYYNPSTFNPAADGTKNQCTTNGVCIPTRLDSGKSAALHDRTTSLTTSKRFAVTRRIKDYLGISIKAALPGFVNGPNTIDNWRLIKSLVEDFLAREQLKGRVAPNPATPNAPAFSTDYKSGNTTSSAAIGQFVLIINATTPAPMEEIFIVLNVGPTVSISVQ